MVVAVSRAPVGDVVWEERITRGVATALMNNFKSVADALNELVDNAVNFRWGQPLMVAITYDKKDLLVVESDGGRGMGANDIRTWLCWGDGDAHDVMDISRYHQGGKGAIGFIGDKVRLWAKRQGEREIWLFEDEDWAKRPEPKNFGSPEPVAEKFLPPTMRNLDLARGHVRIEISKLNQGRRKNLQVLGKSLASTYRSLLYDGDVSIEVDGVQILPLQIPLSTAVPQTSINVKLSQGGRSAHGWAARVNKGELNSNLSSGLRLLHSGRLICEGEWFGYNHSGKGALDSLIGELHLERFQPIPNKTDFVERSEDVWDELAASVKEQIQPLINLLRAGSDEKRATKQEKQTAREVAEELGRILAAAREAPEPGEDVAPAGRRTATARSVEPLAAPESPRARRSPQHPRTPPPLDPVGVLARLISRVTGGGTVPPLRVRGWDPAQRADWVRDDDGSAKQWLDINKNFPIYRRLRGDKAYIAETAILKLCEPSEDETMSATAYSNRVQIMLYRWALEAGLEQIDANDETDDEEEAT